VPQSIVLTDQSIARNIATGIPEEQIDFARVKWCSETAQLGDFIESLPLGLETIVGDNRAEVSGGQRQRIGIARALYKNPSIIIMNEATSALDDETERSFMAAIRNLKNQVTVVMVAHRDGTISSADDVFRPEDGGLAKISSRKGAKK
jgi:ABC-type bacteriocin/lantibiotic exporter with double-glycine peptidase domain